MEGDIIIVREGGGAGKAGIVAKGDKFSLGQRVMMLRPDRSQIDPSYLLYHWLSPLIQEDEIEIRITGSAAPHLNIGAIKHFPLRLPSLDRQREVVAYLDGIREREEELQRSQSQALAELEAVVPSVLNQAFNGRA